MVIQQNCDNRLVFCCVLLLSFIKSFNIKLCCGKSHRPKMWGLLRAFNFKPRSDLISTLSFLFRVWGVLGFGFLFWGFFSTCVFILSNDILKNHWSCFWKVRLSSQSSVLMGWALNISDVRFLQSTHRLLQAAAVLSIEVIFLKRRIKIIIILKKKKNKKKPKTKPE